MNKNTENKKGKYPNIGVQIVMQFLKKIHSYNSALKLKRKKETGGL